MNGIACSFTAQRPRIWRGSYARIPGEGTAFHVRWRGDTWWPAVIWVADGEIATCSMVAGGPAADLAVAVNQGKRLLGGPGGGSFAINEFGQVLVPSSAGDGRVAVVGEWDGALEFTDPLHGGTFDLAPGKPLVNGDLWDRPYLGIPYHLSLRGEIYFWAEGDQGAGKRLPPVQDLELIEALRALRPYGAVRFVVGSGGLVLTKVPAVPQWTVWEARYVGRINYARWFAKEV